MILTKPSELHAARLLHIEKHQTEFDQVLRAVMEKIEENNLNGITKYRLRITLMQTDQWNHHIARYLKDNGFGMRETREKGVAYYVITW